MSTEHSAHTALPWRIGDAGLTVFGPKTNAPSPKTVAHTNRADAAYIVRCVNSHEQLVSALSTVDAWLIAPSLSKDDLADIRHIVSSALSLARGGGE